MKLNKFKKIFAAMASTMSMFLLAACGLGTAGGYSPSGDLAGPLEGLDLDGVTLKIGSKEYTEQILLGKIAVVLMKSAGADVQDLTGIPGSSATRQAMLSGDIGIMWDYTGSAWISYLGHTDPIPDDRKQFEAVRDAEGENGLVWLDPAPMNNTYSFALREEIAEEYGMETLGDIAKLPEADQSYCIETEFAVRNDGFEPMLKAYDLKQPSSKNTRLMDTGAIYQATADQVCTLGEVFTTDGRIDALGLAVLDDDRSFFPNYSVAPVVRDDVLEENPRIKELFAPVAEKITNDVLRELNGRVDIDGEEPQDVAYDWLKSEGFID